MARPRKHRLDLPPRMYFLHGSYFHVVRGKWTNLGRELVAAMRAYHARELGSLRADNLTFGGAAMQYLALGTKDLAPRTVKDYTKYLTREKRLLAVFGECPFHAIEPHHVQQYHRRARELRGNAQANREKAVLSLVWNWARAEGLTSLPNPCQGIHRAREEARGTLVSDTVYRRVWVHADWPTRDALDLARFSAQRPADVFKLRLTDIVDNCLVVKQGKTKRVVRIVIEGKLAKVIARIRGRTGFKVTSTALVRNERGEQLTNDAFRRRFAKARKQAGVPLKTFQLRDMRAKGGTRKAELEGKEAAQALLGHTSVKTTEIYIRNRGKKVRPVE